MPSHCFNYPNADLVLRSSAPDPVEFRVHKCILSLSSAFFESMLSLPQAKEECESAPVIDMSETSRILEHLLCFMYPVPNPQIDCLDDLVLMLEAACKYDVSPALAELRSRLLAPEFVESDPLRVYAVACRFQLEKEAVLASRYTLSRKVSEWTLSEDLRYMSAYQYHKLLELHRKRAAAAQDLIVYANEFKCMVCNGTHYGAYVPPRWWKDWESRARVELAERPTTEVIFSMPFLAESAKAGCERCGGSVLDAQWFLDKLKNEMDALPATI